MSHVKVIIEDSSRHKIVIILSLETKKLTKTNIEIGRINLDRWLRD